MIAHLYKLGTVSTGIAITVFIILIGIILFLLYKIKSLNKLIISQKTYRDAIEEERLRLVQQLDLIFESMEDGVLIVNGDAVVLHSNKSLHKWFDLPDEIKGKKLFDILPDTVSDIFKKSLQEKSENSSINIELRSPRLCSLHIERSLIKDLDGKLYGVAFIFHDQTRLATLEKTRQEFVANVSHELRTPLTLIKGCVETLLEGAKDDPETSVRFLQTIKKHSDRLNFLIQDLLTISKLESGQTKLNLEKLNIRKIVQDIIEDLKKRAIERNVQIHNNISGDIEIVADAERIKQVFYNLIDNAIKYGRIGGNVWINESKDESVLTISVKDDGPGIPPEARERIFERFFRVDKARSREQGGTGLGLSIVKHIVQAHGGKVWVESQFGKGSIFYFTIPLSLKAEATSNNIDDNS